jgi:hypothetical protein
VQSRHYRTLDGTVDTRILFLRKKGAMRPTCEKQTWVRVNALPNLGDSDVTLHYVSGLGRTVLGRTRCQTTRRLEHLWGYTVIIKYHTLLRHHLGCYSILFSLLSLFWKNKVGLWDHVAVCVCIPLINVWMPKPIFMKLGTLTYITAPEPISTA